MPHTSSLKRVMHVDSPTTILLLFPCKDYEFKYRSATLLGSQLEYITQMLVIGEPITHVISNVQLHSVQPAYTHVLTAAASQVTDAAYAAILSTPHKTLKAHLASRAVAARIRGGGRPNDVEGAYNDEGRAQVADLPSLLPLDLL